MNICIYIRVTRKSLKVLSEYVVKKTIMMKAHIEVTNLICGARQVSFNNWNWRKTFYFKEFINCCGFYQKSSNVFLYFQTNSNV